MSVDIVEAPTHVSFTRNLSRFSVSKQLMMESSEVLDMDFDEIMEILQRMEGGIDVIKFSRSGKPQQRRLYLGHDFSYCYYDSASKRIDDCIFYFIDIERIQRGQHTFPFKKHAKEYETYRDSSFSIISTGRRSFDCLIKDSKSFEIWFKGLQLCHIRAHYSLEDRSSRTVRQVFVEEWKKSLQDSSLIEPQFRKTFHPSGIISGQGTSNSQYFSSLEKEIGLSNDEFSMRITYGSLKTLLNRMNIVVKPRSRLHEILAEILNLKSKDEVSKKLYGFDDILRLIDKVWDRSHLMRLYDELLEDSKVSLKYLETPTFTGEHTLRENTNTKLSADAFHTFLVTTQGHTNMTLRESKSICQFFDPISEGHSIDFNAFCTFLYCRMNSSLAPEASMPGCAPESASNIQESIISSSEVAYMSYPLECYFINSSHNTYLEGDQLTSISSVNAYISAVQKGYRCLELDVFDGVQVSSNSPQLPAPFPVEPVIFHGGTLTSKVSVRSVCVGLRDFGFRTSAYPLILSLELHCSREQQRVLARIFKEIFGERLLRRSENVHWSPLGLKGRVVLKAKIPVSSTLFQNDLVSSESARNGDFAALSPLDPVDYSSGKLPNSSDLVPELLECVFLEGVSWKTVSVPEVSEPANVDATDLDSSSTVKINPLSSSNSGGNESVINRSNGNISGEDSPSRVTSRWKRTPSTSNSFVLCSSSIGGGQVMISLSERIAKRLFSSSQSVPQLQYSSSQCRCCSEADSKEISVSNIAPEHQDTPISSGMEWNPSLTNSSPEKNTLRSFGNQTRTHPASVSTSITDPVDARAICSHLVRVFPYLRLDSSNPNPVPFWGVGVQLVALNSQTDDTATRINASLFRLNGKCGFVLKPRFLWSNAVLASHTAASVPNQQLESRLLSSSSSQSSSSIAPSTAGISALPSLTSSSSFPRRKHFFFKQNERFPLVPACHAALLLHCNGIGSPSCNPSEEKLNSCMGNDFIERIVHPPVRLRIGVLGAQNIPVGPATTELNRNLNLNFPLHLVGVSKPGLQCVVSIFSAVSAPAAAFAPPFSSLQTQVNALSSISGSATSAKLPSEMKDNMEFFITTARTKKVTPEVFHSPIWNEDLLVDVECPELAFLYITITDSVKSQPLAYFSAPVSTLRKGFRSCQLYCPGHVKSPFSSLLCKFQVDHIYKPLSTS